MRGDGIKPLNSLFEKYKRQLVAPQGSVKKCFCEVLLDLYGFEVKDTELEYSVYSRTITVRTRGALKSEILLRKEEIIVHLKGRLGERNAPHTII